MFYHSVAKSTSMDHRIKDLLFKVMQLIMQVAKALVATYLTHLFDQADLFIRNLIVVKQTGT
jgi:hypothetical protein